MIHVDFDPCKLKGSKKVWWDKWSAKAAAETTTIITKWETSKKLSSADFNSDVWSELKAWLLEHVFHGKCAYCETHIGISRQPGHAEHFRPKGGVRNREPDKKKLVPATTKDEQGQIIEHPGYFWLAYCWKNLLPSCNDCNTGRGKNNQFPAKTHLLVKKLSNTEAAKLSREAVESPKWTGFYYLGPDDLDKEEDRLLLNPYKDEPRDHIVFGFAGIVSAKYIDGKPSEKGEQSMKVYDLKNNDLGRARQASQDRARDAYLFFYGCESGGKPPLEAGKCARQALATRVGEENVAPHWAAIDDHLRDAVPHWDAAGLGNAHSQ